MAVAYFCQWADESAETAQRVTARVTRELGGHQPPPGGLYHAEGPIPDGGWWTFSVWTSVGAYEAFASQILQPALVAAGVAPAQVQQLQVAWTAASPPEKS